MPHPNTPVRKSAAAVVAILLLACIGLAACGGSSSKTSSSANAASTGTTTGGSSTGSSSTGGSSTGSSTTGSGGPGSARGPARFTAVRECLEKNGIALPQRKPGSARPGGFLGGGAGASGPQLPKGVTRAQYEAALKKCGGHVFAGGGSRRFTNNPVFKAALAKYAECLRQNGVNVPAPNTSGKGPVFDTKGINTGSAQFRTATTKCRSTLTGAFRRPGGAGGPAPGGTPPPGGGSAG